jgi:hypothetical protein
MARSFVRLGSLAALVAVHWTCGGGSKPAGPSGSPTPSPAPTANPSATPTPGAQGLCAQLGYVSTPNTRCNENASGRFQAEADAAIDKAIMEHADIFANGPGGIQVKNPGAYVVYVVQNVNQAGFCADYDGEELQIKTSNDFNEQYDILTASNYVRKGSSYQASCSPAAFPTPPPPPIPPPPGCGLPSSRELSCGASTESYRGPLNAAIDQAVQEHPEVFDTSRTRGAPDAYLVTNEAKYLEYVASNLTARGFCARWDGEEMVVKATNAFSDHFDIITSEGYIRRGGGQYSVSCYPAAF